MAERREAPARRQTAAEMFAQFGIDTRSQQEILAERAKENVQDAMNADYVERYPGDAGLQKAGALLGTALKNKFNNKLTAEDKREQQAAKDARAAVQSQVDDGLYQDAEGNVDAVERALALRKELAKSLVRQQDQRGIEMLVQIGEEERQRKKDQTAQRAAELGVESKENQLRKEEWEWNRRVVDEMAEVWPIDSLDPNDSVQLYIDATGTARNPETFDVVYPAGEWSKNAPIPPEAARHAIDGELTDLEEAMLPSQKERAQFRRRERDVMTSMRLGIGITNAMKDAVNPDGTLNILSTGGKITDGAVKVLDNLMAAGRGLSDTLFVVDADGKEMPLKKSSAQSYIASNREFFESLPLPDSIDRTDPRAVTQFWAIMTQYGYAKARLNEENGRISDVDFEHALTQLAAAASDPEALRRVLAGDVEQSVAEFDQWTSQIHPSVRGLVRTAEAKANFDRLHEEWDTTFELDFGTPSEVGAGLLTEKTDMTPPLHTPIAQPQGETAEMSVTEFLNGGYSSEEDFLNSFNIEQNKEDDE